MAVVNSLKGQVDKLYLCLNGFWEVPEDLKQDWIDVIHVGKNLGPCARFFLLRHIVGEFDFDLISCDDDLIYPDSYVDDFLKYKEDYPGCVLTHHGSTNSEDSIIPSVINDVVCLRENESAKVLQKPGAGVSFFPGDLFSQMEFNSSTTFYQCDYTLSAICMSEGFKIIGLPHSKDYFEYVEPNDGYTIWDSVTSKDSVHEKHKLIFNSYGLKDQSNG